MRPIATELLQQVLLKTGQHLPVDCSVWLYVKGRRNIYWISVHNAIEAIIGHNKLGRDFLNGSLAAQVNAVMSAVGYNFRLFL